MHMRERYVGTLVGCAAGDALGMPVEGWTREQIAGRVGRIIEPIAPITVKDGDGKLLAEDKWGKVLYFTSQMERGDYTDDTILTLAIAESIVAKRGFELDDICGRQVVAYVGNKTKGFGGTTSKALRRLQYGVLPYNSGVINGAGSGTCMKMAPVGLYVHATGKYEHALAMARRIGLATHLDERAVASGVVQAHAIYQLLNGADRSGFLDSLVECCTKYEKPLQAGAVKPWIKSLGSRLEWVQKNRDAGTDEALKELGNSCLAFECYPFTIFMFQKYWSALLEGLVETVNYGGDCDTTGAMYGALAGAKDGIFFPNAWRGIVKGLEPLEKAAEGILALRTKAF